MSLDKKAKIINSADPLAAIKELDNKLDSCMASFESRMATASTTSMEQLVADVKQFKVVMKLAIELIRSQMNQVTSLVDEAENRSRRKFLLFRGIVETHGENLKEVITKVVVDSLKLTDFTPECIHFCYRLGKDSTRGEMRPVLVKFQSLDMRSTIWRNKKELKGSTVSVAEYLTALRRSFFNEGRKIFGVHKCWSQDGSVYLLTSDGTKHRVISHCQLREIVTKFPPPSAENLAACPTVSKAAPAATSQAVPPASSSSVARSSKTGRLT